MKGIKYSILSLGSSSLCIVGLIIHNYNLSLAYLSSGGKDRAFFGLTELFRLHIKLYFIPFVLLAIVFGILAGKKTEKKTWVVACILAFMLAFVSFFIRYWRFMI
jgi:hypothetical protein